MWVPRATSMGKPSPSENLYQETRCRSLTLSRSPRGEVSYCSGGGLPRFLPKLSSLCWKGPSARCEMDPPAYLRFLEAPSTGAGAEDSWLCGGIEKN